ncbi:glycosyltransferase family 4 protein [Tunturiibacter lichenicola]|uniref:glycosyltransferase family 4 protein n=1 Tax=Tunturiibacter lichenicola TaxID=2051959 RepID=UPI003D9AE09F
MRVMYVDQTGQLGGGELSLLDVIKHSPFHSEIVLFDDGPFRTALEDLNVPVHLLHGGSLSKVRSETRLKAVLEAGPAFFGLQRRLAKLTAGFDVVYANSQKAFLVSAATRRKGQLLIWHLRDMLTADHFSPMMRVIAVEASNLTASIVITNSQATADSFVQCGGKLEKVVVVYNGISPEPFDAVTETMKQSMLQELGLRGKYLVGVFGRLSPWKGQHILLEAIASLPYAHAVLVGDALFGEDSYVESLRQRAQAPDLEGRVHFLGFRKDVSLLMKCMNIIAHTSTSPEPFGRVIVEAMLAGRPTIASRAGGVLEIVRGNETGLLVLPGCPLDLSAAIQKYHAHPGLARRIADAGRERAINHFSVHAMADGIEEVLRNCMAREEMPILVDSL